MTQSQTANKKQKKSLFGFVTTKPLWVNILVGIGLGIILVLIFLQSLDWMTMHGTTLTIPSVTGKTYSEAAKTLEDQGFDVLIQDSVYVDTTAPLIVIRQFPEADATVKRNRTVYLTINRAIPPLIEMPQLEGLTYRSAVVALKQYGLSLGDTSYTNSFARDAVIEQYHDKTRIKPGTKIHMGSTINLVLGSGLGSEEFAVPDLFGRKLSEVLPYLEAIGLIVDARNPPDLANNPEAYIYDQEPKAFTPDGRVNMVRSGQLVDLFLQLDKPVRNDSTTAPKQNDYE